MLDVQEKVTPVSSRLINTPSNIILIFFILCNLFNGF